jgi:hypothetical protein
MRLFLLQVRFTLSQKHSAKHGFEESKTGVITTLLRPVLSRRFRVDLGSIDRVCPLFSDRSADSDPIDPKKYLQIGSKSRYFFNRFGIDRELGMPRSLVSILCANVCVDEKPFYRAEKRETTH